MLDVIAHTEGTDLTSPQCRRCILAKLHCGGIHGLAILQYDGEKNVSRPRAISANVAAQPAEEGAQLIFRAHQRSLWTIAATPSSRSQPFAQDLFKAYTNSRLFHGTWSAVVPNENSQPLTSACFAALSTTFFGLEHRHRPTINNGLSLYVSALRSLNQSLHDPIKFNSLDTLTSVVALTLFELLSSDQEDGWLSHSRGLERLFSLLGAEAVTALPLLTLFEKSRANMIFSALLLRKPTVLSTSEWKDVPWRLYPDRIDAMKTLQDILADCTDLFYLREKVDKEIPPTVGTQSVRELLAKSCTITSELESWRAAWANSAAYCCTEVPVPNITQSEASARRVKPPWFSVLRYQSFWHANVMTLYQSMVIMTYSVVQETRTALRMSKHENIQHYPRGRSYDMPKCRLPPRCGLGQHW